MPVLIFQAVIVFSMMIARRVSAQSLRNTAIAWSAFTLVMVFMPWLMVLQFAVIWISYAKLRPGEGGSSEHSDGRPR